MKVKIDSIKVKDRIRKDMGNINKLSESLNKHGQLNPIVINSKRELIAGERRLEAAKILGWSTIDAKILKDISEIDKLEIEIDENVHRKHFTESEIDEAYKKLNSLKNPKKIKKFWLAIKKFFKKLFRIKN